VRLWRPGTPAKVGRVRLSKEAGTILGGARIGMLALRSGRAPLVNPAAFSVASGYVWMTTSRFAVKTVLARRDPRAAFFVTSGSRAVLLRGTLEVFDPLSVTAQVRALLGGPALYLGMAAYALKNAPFVAGYLIDLARLPREWMPYNRVVLRFAPTDLELMDVHDQPKARAARVPAVPPQIGRSLASVPRGYASWFDSGRPVIVPVLWNVEDGQVFVAPSDGRRPRAGAGGALVVEAHHPFRPSQMVGACLRGTFETTTDGASIAERYGIDIGGVRPAMRLLPDKVTSWRGFAITTTAVRASRPLGVAQA
jgi:hypothetical protein